MLQKVFLSCTGAASQKRVKNNAIVFTNFVVKSVKNISELNFKKLSHWLLFKRLTVSIKSSEPSRILESKLPSPKGLTSHFSDWFNLSLQ